MESVCTAQSEAKKCSRAVNGGHVHNSQTKAFS